MRIPDRTRKMIGVVIIVLAMALLFIVALSSPPPVVEDTSTPALTAEAAALPTAQYMECGWQWATQPLPELTAQIAAALAEAGITDAAVQAKAYGENCVPQRADVAGYFATMETDFDVTLTVADTGDDTEIGSRLASILDVLALFPPDETPGPNPGYVMLIVSGPEDAQRIQRFLVTDAADARDQGLTGADLLAALDTGN